MLRIFKFITSNMKIDNSHVAGRVQLQGKKKKKTFGYTDSATSFFLGMSVGHSTSGQIPIHKTDLSRQQCVTGRLLWKLSTPTTIPATLERVILPPPAISHSPTAV